jgi:hypothetical protein
MDCVMPAHNQHHLLANTNAPGSRAYKGLHPEPLSGPNASPNRHAAPRYSNFDDFAAGTRMKGEKGGNEGMRPSPIAGYMCASLGPDSAIFSCDWCLDAIADRRGGVAKLKLGAPPITNRGFQVPEISLAYFAFPYRLSRYWLP